MAISFEWIRKPTGILKCVTLILNIICIGILSGGSIGYDKDQMFLCITTSGGFILVDLALIFGYVLENTHGQAKFQEVAVSSLAVVLLAASSTVVILNVKDVDGADLPKAYGGLCVITGVAYILHIFFAIITKR